QRSCARHGLRPNPPVLPHCPDGHRGALCLFSGSNTRGMKMLRWSLLLSLVLAGAACTQEAPHAQNASDADDANSVSSVPRTASGKPDLQGIWQAQGTAAYDLEDHLARHDMPAGMGYVDGPI